MRLKYFDSERADFRETTKFCSEVRKFSVSKILPEIIFEWLPQYATSWELWSRFLRRLRNLNVLLCVHSSISCSCWLCTLLYMSLHTSRTQQIACYERDSSMFAPSNKNSWWKQFSLVLGCNCIILIRWIELWRYTHRVWTEVNRVAWQENISGQSRQRVISNE